MLVPGLLFGTAREVSAKVGKVVTQLNRGASLEHLCESASPVDLGDFPESLVWIDEAWGLRSNTERDCRAVLLTHGIFDGKRIPFERSNSIREESVAYLSGSPWGTVLLNAGRGGEWHTALPLRPLRPSRRGFVATLAGTLRHWEALMALGPRYYSGGSHGRTFPETLPAYGGVLAKVGIDPRGEGDGWEDVRSLGELGALVARLDADDEFWDNLVRKWRRDAGTPDLTEENLVEITRLCEGGSWDGTQWEYLRRQGGAEAVERALAEIALSGKWGTLLGVYIHVLRDMKRATRLFFEHAAAAEVQWAEIPIARHLRAEDPAGSASLLLQAAERQLEGGQRRYREALRTLEEAHDVCIHAHLESLWQERLKQFLFTHRRRKALVAWLHQAFGAACDRN